MFVSHTKHTQWKIKGYTSFAIDIKECPTFTYIPFHVYHYKILYVSLFITDYLIGLAFWAFPIGLYYVAWSGIKREQIRY